MFKRAVVSPEGGTHDTEPSAWAARTSELHHRHALARRLRSLHSVLKRSFVPVADLIQGGTMELLMASRPDVTFGAAKKAPPLAWESTGFVTVPSISAPQARRLCRCDLGTPQ